MKVFSSTGGIEKMNRIAGKALHESGFPVKIFSSHDETKTANKYFPQENYFVFNGNKLRFVLKSVAEGIKSDIVILSHYNLITVGFLIKILAPKTRLVLFAHGIEIWKPVSWIKKKMLLKCDRIIAVSHFTENKLKESGYVTPGSSVVLNNCLDPFLQNIHNEKSAGLLARYGLSPGNFILFTLTRLNSDEKYKGYDKVLGSLKELIKDYPQLHYLIAGKYDAGEYERVNNIINSCNLQNFVTLTGFIKDDELVDHFNLADLYIMPSRGEGFGIVFIEAMNYGLPVIAGNKDGSTDALLNGNLGLLVDPDDQEEITAAIRKVISDRFAYKPNRELLLNNFSYEVYKEKLIDEIQQLIN